MNRLANHNNQLLDTSNEKDNNYPPDTASELGRIASFSVLNRASFPEVRRISGNAYPDDYDLRYFKKGGLKELLEQPGAGQFSFMIADSATGRASGYCIAYYNLLDNHKPDPTSLYVDNFAVSPGDQGSGFGLQGLSELFRRVQADGHIKTIDMSAREATSYQAIMDHQDLLRLAGYTVEDLGIDEDFGMETNGGTYDIHSGTFANEGERIHHLVLKRVAE